MTESRSVPADNHRAALREVLVVLGLSVALWCWWSWPLVGSIDSAMFGLPGDSTGSIYDLWHGCTFGFSVLPGSMNELLAYPTGLPNGGPLLLPGIILFVPGVMLALVSNEIIAYNILILCGFVITAIASYVFFRSALATRVAAAAMSTAFTVLPYHQLSLLQWYGQGQLAGIPLTAYFCLKMHRNPHLKTLLAVMGSTLASFLMNAYVGLLSVVMALGGIVITSVAYRSRLRAALRVISARGLTLGMVVLFTVPTVLVLLSQEVRKSVNRPVDELRVYGLRPRELVQPTAFSTNSLFKSVVPPMHNLHGSNLVEVSQYIGISVVVLAVVSGLLIIKRRRTTWCTKFGLATVGLGLLFGITKGVSLGPVHIPSPAEAISHFVPFWRVYSRFGLLVGFGCLMLVGELLDLIFRARVRRCAFQFLGVSLCLMIFADLWIASPGVLLPMSEPSYVQFLAKESRGVMMEYPLAAANDLLRYQRRFSQRKLKNPSVNGDYETDFRIIRLGADNPELPQSRSTLQALGVQWVIVQDAEYVSSGVPVPKLDATFGTLRFNADGVRVFEIPRQTATGVAWVDEGGFPVESNGASTGQWINKTARIVVARKNGGCARLVMSVGLYPGVQELRVRQDGQDAIVSRGGVIDLKLASFTDATQVTVSSIQDPIQIPGPDPRSVSAWINSEMRVVSSPCP